MLNRILLLGGGGHCKSIIDTLLNNNQYSEIAIIDKEENIGKKILGVPIIGCDAELPKFYQEGFKEAFVSVGSVGDSEIREKLFGTLEKIGFKIPNIVDSTALISNHVKLEKGIFVGKNVVINTDSFIHKGSIINTSTTIEHDCEIEEFAHIAPGSVLCGHVRIGAKTHIGAKSVIKQQIRIGSNTMIGMGSVVLNDIGNDVLAFGCPCREVQRR